MSPLRRLRVDFSEVAVDELLTAFLSAPVAPNEPVVLFDGDGNACMGRVVRSDKRMAWVLPAWKTWLPAGGRIRLTASNEVRRPFKVWLSGSISNENLSAVETTDESVEYAPPIAV